MKGKPTRGRSRIQTLHDLANDDDCVSLKWASEDREGWRHRERLPMLLMMTNILSSYVIIIIISVY